MVSPAIFTADWRARIPKCIFSGLDRLWKETHGVTQKTGKRPKAVKTSSPELKYCYGCERERDRDEFSVDRSRKDGLNNRCRECCAGYFKETQSRLCCMCGFQSIGKECRRCYRWIRAIRGAEYETISIIPNMIAQREKELLAPLSKAQQSAYHEAKKLRNRALELG